MTYILISAYLAVLLYIGYRAYYRETVRDFFVANRKLSMWSAGISLGASWIDASFIFLAITLGYFVHWNILWFCLGFTAQLLIYIIFVKKVKKLIEKYDAFSYLDLIYKKLGKPAGVVCAVGIFSSYVLWNGLQYYIGADILKMIFGFSLPLSLGIMAVFTLIYLILGGFKASIKTDVFQFALIALFTIALFFVLPPLGEVTRNVITFGTDGETRKHIFEIIIFIIACGLSADGIIRIMATKNEKHAKGSVFVALSIFFVIFGFFGYVGYVMFTYNSAILEDNLFAEFFHTFVPKEIYGLAVLALLSALMSSIDTYTFTASQALTTDGLMHFNLFKKYTQKNVLRVSFGVVTVLSIIMSMTVTNILDFFFIALAWLGCGLPVFLALITGWSKHKYSISLTVGLGILTHVILFLVGDLNEETSVIATGIYTLSWFTLEMWEKLKNKK